MYSSLSIPIQHLRNQSTLHPARELQGWDSNQAPDSSTPALPHDAMLSLFNKSDFLSSKKSI